MNGICSDGQTRRIQIGVTGFVTPQITKWDKAALEGQIETQDIVNAAQAVVPLIKAAGADLIVALCHAGIGSNVHTDRMENAAVPLAAVAGIDVVLTGHTHDIFPDSRPDTPHVSHTKSSLHGKPAMMAGFFGHTLGIMDLSLAWVDDGRWQIMTHKTQLMPCKPTRAAPSALQQTLISHVKSAHNATLNKIRKPIARTDHHIHSFFATFAADLGQQTLAAAQTAHVADALRHNDLPILSVTAPYRFGARAGASHYVDIPPGAITLRDAAAIYPFTNTLSAVRHSGQQIKMWLERAASHFNRVTVGEHHQTLINQHSPGYHCDTIYGLDYEFDLLQPALFDANGTMTNANTRRVTCVQYDGVDVADDDQFIIAANSYRVNGGGSFAGIPIGDVVYISLRNTRQILIDYMRRCEIIAGTIQHPMRFAHLPQTQATFHSGVGARNVVTPGIEHVGLGEHGFHKYRLTF